MLYSEWLWRWMNEVSIINYRRLFPFDCRRRFRRTIIPPRVAALALVDGARRDPREPPRFNRNPVGRHPVDALDEPQHDDLVVGPLIAHHPDRAHREEDGEGLPELVGELGSAALL